MSRASRSLKAGCVAVVVVVLLAAGVVHSKDVTETSGRYLEGDEVRALIVAAEQREKRAAIGERGRCDRILENNKVIVFSNRDEVAVLFYSNGRCAGPDSVVLDGGLLAVLRRKDAKLIRWHEGEESEVVLKRFKEE